MKKLLIIILMLTVVDGFAQDTLSTQVFSLTPLAMKTDKVNGFAFGLGHLWNNTPKKRLTVNGLNVELNPALPFALLFMDPSKAGNEDQYVTINGLHLSTFGIMSNGKINGLGISGFNVGLESANGLMINVLYNFSGQMNGIHISGLGNSATQVAGVQVALYNKAFGLYGLQAGVINEAVAVYGLQIGLYNKATKVRGLQVGLWNINEKRSMPFVNW
ncbi:MAG: LA_2272 family surface repeat-containing protein [Bacteroidia bacterium]